MPDGVKKIVVHERPPMNALSVGVLFLILRLTSTSETSNENKEETPQETDLEEQKGKRLPRQNGELSRHFVENVKKTGEEHTILTFVPQGQPRPAVPQRGALRQIPTSQSQKYLAAAPPIIYLIKPVKMATTTVKPRFTKAPSRPRKTQGTRRPTRKYTKATTRKPKRQRTNNRRSKTFDGDGDATSRPKRGIDYGENFDAEDNHWRIVHYIADKDGEFKLYKEEFRTSAPALTSKPD